MEYQSFSEGGLDHSKNIRLMQESELYVRPLGHFGSFRDVLIVCAAGNVVNFPH